jgi:hypothetical protein
MWNSDVKEVLECNRRELTREMKQLHLYYCSISIIIMFLELFMARQWITIF